MKHSKLSPERLNLLIANKKSNRPLLDIPDSARAIHNDIVAHIQALLASVVRSPLAPEFCGAYAKMLCLLEQFQNEVIAHSAYTITCSRGCTRCCFHWVEDVYSFEGEIIADYIRKNMLPEKISELQACFKRDIAEIKKLDVLVAEKLGEYSDDKEAAGIDPVDVLLASFYQLRRPCPLLTLDGACSIYPVRPLTCRVYLSFSDPVYCDPDYINVADVRTHLLDLEENASELLDRLHLEFDRYDGDMGLRSLLLKCLAQDCGTQS